MRLFLLIAVVFFCGWCYGQGNGFSFSYTGPSQILVGEDCVAPLNWGHPNTPTAACNIAGCSIVSFNIYSISGGYEIGDMVQGGTTVTVFYQAIDNFGNSALFGFTITFTDNIPPEFVDFSLPPNLTVNCTGNFPVADVEVTDNCQDADIVLTVTFSEINNAAPCTGGLITRKWTADDDLGNTSVFIQTITVLPDVTPPVIANNLQNGSSPCQNAMNLYAMWLSTQRANFMATDNGCGVMTLSDNAPAPAIITSFCGVITVIFTAKDNCNNISTVTKTFTITNTVPPVITTPASNAMGNCNQSNINTLFNNWINSHGGAMATDDCSSIFWTTSPPNPSINDTCDAAIQVMFIAGDGCNNFDTTSASFFLTDDTPPVITAEPTTMILSCGLTTIDSILNDWLIKYGHSAAHDLCTSDSDLIKGYRIGSTDLTLAQVLQVWQDSLDAGCNDNVIINGIGINNVKAHIAVDFVYDDKCSNEVSETGFFGITDNGRPTFVTNPVDTSFVCSLNDSWQDVFNTWYNSAGGATFMDQCSEVTVNASITADSAIQYLTSALDTACQQGVAVTINFQLQDDCGNLSLLMAPATFSLQDSTPPILTNPANDFMASCTENGQLQLNSWLDTLGGAEATDGCGNLTWTFSWIDTSGQQSGVPGSGPYPFVTDLNCSDGLEVIFTASDVCQNSISDTAVFTILDTIAPVIIIATDTVNISCTDTIPFVTPGATDNCGGNITLDFIETVGGDSCLGGPEMIMRIWTAADECGNSSSAVELFLRIDTLPPTFELPSDSVEFCGVDTLELINVADNCDPEPISSSNDMISGPVCSQTLTRTWTVTDACGNSATAEQVFDLSDSTPPVITLSPGDVVYSCSNSEGSLQEVYEAWQDSVAITDGCSDSDFFIALQGSYVLGDTSTWPGTPVPDSVLPACDVDVSILADLVAFDVCGNVVVVSISFIVNDTVAPVFTNCIAVLDVEPDTSSCTGFVSLIAPDYDENCYPDDVIVSLILDGGDTIVFDTFVQLDTIMDVGIHTALWTATDCIGNAGTCFTSIEIIDEEAIALECPADTLLFTTDDTCLTSLWVYPPFSTIGKCGKGAIELRFEVEGNASPDSVVFTPGLDSVFVAFSVGINNVLLIARDSTGDIDTCIYTVELRDTIDPVITCQSDTLFISVDGPGEFNLDSSALVSFADDNCGVHSIVYDPPIVTCNQFDQTVNIEIVVFDQSGNTGTCETTLFVTTDTLQPGWSRGLCDDTLRLFSNISPDHPMNLDFSWTGPNSFASIEENPVISAADSTFSGTYILTVTSDGGCIFTGSVDVLIETLVSPIVLLSDDTICEGQTVLLTTQTYSGNVTYHWYRISPDGDTLVANTSTPSLTFQPNTTGLYTFFAVVTQDTCASEPSPDKTLFVAAIPVAGIAEVSILCEFDTLFLSPQVVIDSFTYLWIGPGGFISNEPLPPGIPASEIDTPGIFTLVVSGSICSSAPDTLMATIQAPPATPAISGDSIACAGGSFTLTSTPTGESYTWIDPQSNEFTTTDNSLNIPLADPLQSGAWYVIAFLNGCPSDTSAPFIVQIDSGLQIQIIAPPKVCEGDSVTLVVSPATTGTYTWSGPGGFASGEVSPTVAAEEGTYNVFVSTTTGCEAMDSVLIEVDNLPSILSIETDADSCADGMSDVQLWAITIPASDEFVYNWSGPLNFSSQDSSPVIQDFDSGMNGIYALFIINGTCTSDTATITINVVDSPAPPVIDGENTYCFGDTIILNIDNPIPGAFYIWSSTDTTLTVASPGTLILENATSGMKGVYEVVVNIAGCISASSSFTVQVRPSLLAPVITSSLLACEGGTYTLTSNTPAGATLFWSGPNGFVSNDVSPVISPVTPGDTGAYYLYYELNGCPSDSSIAHELDVQPTVDAPAITTSVSAFCIDAIVPFDICIDPGSATPGAQYLWLLNETTILFVGPDSCITIEGSPLTEGNNSITAIAAVRGCPSDTSAVVIITGDAIPEQSADAGADVSYCPDEIIYLDATDPSPATGVWTTTSDLVFFDEINNPGTLIDPVPSGEYVVTWTLSYASCINYDSDSVVVDIVFTPIAFPDTVEVPFGITGEFDIVANDQLLGIPFTFQFLSNPDHGNALHAGNGVVRYSPNIGFVGTDMFTYRLCSTVCPEECGEAVVVIRVGNEDDCFVPTLFTPNGDGVNDELIVPCLETERYPENELIVFNEWGDVVYKASPYHNDWRGESSGNPLPVGTYFYIMDFGDGSEPKHTFLVLER